MKKVLYSLTALSALFLACPNPSIQVDSGGGAPKKQYSITLTNTNSYSLDDGIYLRWGNAYSSGYLESDQTGRSFPMTGTIDVDQDIPFLKLELKGYSSSGDTYTRVKIIDNSDAGITSATLDTRLDDGTSATTWSGITPIVGGTSSNTAVALTSLGTWYSDELFSSTTALWYKFTTVPGNGYVLSWDDGYEGSSNYDGDIEVILYRSDKTTQVQLWDSDSGFYEPDFFKAIDSTYYIKVIPYDNDTINAGTFKIGLGTIESSF